LNNYDLQLQDNLEQIKKSEWVKDNRAKWKDGSDVYTKRILHVVNRYDLSKAFPATTLRPTALGGGFKEVDWIHRKKSNNVNDLGMKIWDDWSDEEGSIGKGYGYQVNKPVFGYDSQIDYILNEIKRNPSSRRLIVEMWNVNELHEMNLVPCCHHLNFSVDNGKLHLLLKQRSNDCIVANNFNVVEYALLVHMVARHTNLEVGTLTHVITDLHIYNKHVEQMETLLSRTPYEAPQLWINPNIKDFYDFKIEDFKLLNYEHHPQIKRPEVAV